MLSSLVPIFQKSSQKLPSTKRRRVIPSSETRDFYKQQFTFCNAYLKNSEMCPSTKYATTDNIWHSIIPFVLLKKLKMPRHFYNTQSAIPIRAHVASFCFQRYCVSQTTEQFCYCRLFQSRVPPHLRNTFSALMVRMR